MAAGAGGAGDTQPGHVLGGWGSGLNFNWEGVFGLNLPNFISIADLGLPVGLGGVPLLEPWLGLPSQDAEVVTLEQQDAVEERHEFISDEVDRRDAAPNESVLPTVLGPNTTTVLWGGPQGPLTPQEQSDYEWNQIMFPGEVWLRPGSAGTVTPTATVAPATPEAQIVSGDNVSWIEDIYYGVDREVFGGGLPGGYIAPPSPAIIPSNLPTTTSTVTPIPGTPPAAVNPAIKQYCYKLVDGQWKLVKMRRRRRKQLATKGDLQDLAALKGILGLGKAFEVWIATHA